MKNLKTIICGATLLGMVNLVSAVPVGTLIYTDETTFDAAANGVSTFELALVPPVGGISQEVTPSLTVGNVTYSDSGGLFLFNDGFYGNGVFYLGGFNNDLSLSISGDFNAVYFYAGLFGGANTADISVNGGTPTEVELPGAPNSSFIGIVDLTAPITSLAFTDANNSEGNSGGEFDILAPSYVQPVPEPSMLALAAMGGLGGLLVRRRRK